MTADPTFKMRPSMFSKRNAALAVVIISLSGCVSHSRDVTYQARGLPYKTRTGCTRITEVSAFDPQCDVPLLGYSGFANP